MMVKYIRNIAVIIFGIFSASLGQAAIAQQLRAYDQMTWRPVALGAGGQLTGIDIAPDGTKVVKTDAFGAYIWDLKSNRWEQLINASGWGAMAIAGASGVWEIRIAPSLTTRLYMIVNGFTYRSDDRGGHWLKTSLGMISDSINDRNKPADANGKFKFANQKMAVDPANENVVYVGTTIDGVWRSFDGGASWTRVTDIPVSTSGPGSAGIVFDPNSGTTRNRTNTIYVPSYGKGVWKSMDAGKTWRQIANGAAHKSPVNVWTAQIGADGVYWCSEQTHTWKYANSGWSERLDHVGRAMGGVHAIVTDPIKPGRVIFLTDNAKAGWETLDNGVSLVGGNGQWFSKYPPPGQRQIAEDIPWLQDSDRDYMTLGDAKIDPTSGKLYIAEGIGVWWANWPTTFSAFIYHSQSTGIEELVANDVIAPVGGNPLFGVWDRGVFRSDNLSKYPSRYYLINGAFTAGWGLDYAADNPAFVVALNNWPGSMQSGFSSDSGHTWHLFQTQPDTQHPGGCIAAATASNIIVVPANNGVPTYTKNGGKSWIPLAGNGNAERLPTDGWIAAFYLHSHIVAADRVAIGTFYLYNFIHGVYKTTDGGDNWSLVHRGPVANNSGWNARLRTAPGYAGHLWYTSGPGGGVTGQLMRSTNGGISWSTVPKVFNVADFGFGKSKFPGGYPTIFVVGSVNGIWGIWRSDDEAKTWIMIGKNPNNNVDSIKTINGDMNAYGTAYVGFSGSGFSYGIMKYR